MMSKKIPIISSFSGGYFRLVELLAILIVLTAAMVVGYLAIDKLKEASNNVGDLQKLTLALRDQTRQVKKAIEAEKAKDPSSDTQVIVKNLEAFQTRFLKDPQQGRLYVINQINKLVKSNGLNLTGGISFEKVDDAAEKEKGNAKIKGNVRTKENTKGQKNKTDGNSLYPALGMNFSVSGNYVAFRKFLYSLETDKMFFVIDGLNLQTPDGETRAALGGSQRVTNVQKTIQQNPGEITVQIDVKAYFRREKNVTN